MLLAEENVEATPPSVIDTSDDAPSNSEVASRPVATPAQVAAWVAKLDDNRYLVREQASQQLFEAGSAALDPLLTTANGERPEPSDRAVWILRRLAVGKDRSLRRPALERLALVENRPQIAAAARETLVALRHREAVEALQQLGGRYSESQQFGMFALPRVILDHQWRGGDAGLVHLEGLATVGTVAVVGTDITADGLTQLQKVRGLQDLLLYGTQLELDDKEKLEKVLPQVRIEYRRGGLLGVRSDSAEGPPRVAMVQPGSAAEAAGIKAGDEIQEFEGERVPNFLALTNMIGQRRAGEEVTLEVVRNGQPIEFKLRLGAWETLE
jgi:hypothetical protein